MPIPAQRDLEQSRAALCAWLSTKLAETASAPVTDVVVSELRAPGGTGFSNETLLADVQWREGGQDRTDALVVRVEPSGYQVFLEADFELQHRLLSTLDSETVVPVPPTLWFEHDTSVLGARFFVMRKVEGSAPADVPSYNVAGWFFDATPLERHAAWRNAMNAMIAVHKIPLETVAFLAKPELGETGFDQIFEYWRRSYEWAARGKEQPVVDAAWEWLTSNMPTVRPTALSWGDARLGNLMFENGEITAVLDWEMLSLGGPVMDLGWWLFLEDFQSFEVPPLDGMGTREETVALWEAETGQIANDLDWYIIFAGFRFAVVMIRIMQMYAEWGVVPDDGINREHDNPVSRLLARKLGIHPFAT